MLVKGPARGSGGGGGGGRGGGRRESPRDQTMEIKKYIDKAQAASHGRPIYRCLCYSATYDDEVMRFLRIMMDGCPGKQEYLDASKSLADAVRESVKQCYAVVEKSIDRAERLVEMLPEIYDLCSGGDKQRSVMVFLNTRKGASNISDHVMKSMTQVLKEGLLTLLSA